METILPRFVFNMFRHGARTSVPLNNQIDICGNKWSYPQGQLTDKGRQQHLDLGEVLKERYSSLLNPDTFVSYCTDYHRTKESLEKQLTGMFKDQEVVERIMKETFIISQTNLDLEIFHFDKVKSGKHYSDVSKDFQQLYDEIKANRLPVLLKHSAVENDGSDPFTTECLCNAITCSIMEGYPMDIENKEEALEVAGEMFKLFYTKYYVTCIPEFVEANNTNLFKKMFELSEDGKTQYFSMSCHDISLIVMMNHLNRVFGSDILYPDFASYLTIEFYEDNSLKVLFKGEELLKSTVTEFREKIEATYRDPKEMKECLV